jgi:hypothetical protein
VYYLKHCKIEKEIVEMSKFETKCLIKPESKEEKFEKLVNRCILEMDYIKSIIVKKQQNHESTRKQALENK